MNHKLSTTLITFLLSIIFIISTSVNAQELKARDILGIKLGATPQQVVSILEQIKPKLNLNKSFDFIPSNQALQGPLLQITAETIGTERENGYESIKVTFAATTERVIAISRSHNNKPGYDKEMVAEAMKQKYGGTFISENKGDTISIGYNDAGKLENKCINRTGDTESAGVKLRGCGDSFSVRFESQDYQTQLYRGYRASLVDNKAVVDNFLAIEAKLAASGQDAVRRAQETARIAKPAL